MYNQACISWCERVVNSVETFNTLSNIIYIVVGCQWSGNYLIDRCNKSLCLVGIGSFLFHYYGTYLFQLMDEIPMSLLTYYYFCMIHQGLNLKLVYLRLYVFFLYVSYFFYIATMDYNVFKAIMSVQIGITILGTSILVKTVRQKVCFSVSVIYLLAAKLLWEYERYLYKNNICPTSGLSYFLHSFWHIGSAMGHYYLMLTFIELMKYQTFDIQMGSLNKKKILGNILSCDWISMDADMLLEI